MCDGPLQLDEEPTVVASAEGVEVDTHGVEGGSGNAAGREPLTLKDVVRVALQ